MPLSQDDKDEIRLLIAKESMKILDTAFSSVMNAPINPSEFEYANSKEGIEEREMRKQFLRKSRVAVLESVDANLREAEARIVEKTDPERAEIIRKLVPEF